jgi:T4-like virus tail tube protein gp19
MANDLLYPAPLVNEPLRKNRFTVSFPSDLGIQEWWVSAAKMPSYTAGETEIEFINTSTYVLGRYKWEPITVTFRQFIGPSTMQALMEWIRMHSESVTGRQGYAAGYKRNVTISMLDPTGVVIQKWVLVNAFITSADNGTLSHGDDGILETEVTFRYDYAINVF